ncbi:MAG: metal-dependent hydrolase [Oscillospiraceae bacterium]|nr:metal-dependent hydrolase [Oscillospiraceae bacterium]
MTGKTHKFIGLTAGAVIAYTAVQENPAALFYLIACPIGAMLPDIDHDKSKLGQGRKNIMKAAAALFGSFAFVAAVFFLADAYQKSNILPAVITLLAVTVPFALFVCFTKIKTVKNSLKFMVKHRGLMHTLILPAFMSGAAPLIFEPMFKILLIGVNIGYLTHILSDLLTVRGCPVLYPLTKKNIRFLNIKTGSPGEYTAGLVLSGLIAALFLSGLVSL